MHITTIPMSLSFLRGQVGYMKARGLRVHALSSPGEDLDAFGRSEGVPVHAVEMTRRITPIQDLRAIARLRRILVEVRPTIVHAHTPKGGLIGMIASALGRVPVRIYQMRGLPLMTATGPKRWLLRRTEKMACGLSHRVLCNSRSMRDVAISEGICPRDKIAVLLGGSGNGVDAEGRFNPAIVGEAARSESRRRLEIPPSATVLGFVGRIVRDKGVVELLEAWRRIREEDTGIHMLLVGPFEDHDPLPADTELRLRRDPRIHLTGMDWNTPPLYAAMDLVILPTHREGFPNVPLEAAAMRLPVVTTRIPGCVDAVEDGITGTLVPPRDPEALLRAIRAYLEDSVLRHAHGAAGRERVLREFRQEQMWEALYSEYVRLLQKRSRARPPGEQAAA